MPNERGVSFNDVQMVLEHVGIFLSDHFPQQTARNALTYLASEPGEEEASPRVNGWPDIDMLEETIRIAVEEPFYRLPVMDYRVLENQYMKLETAIRGWSEDHAMAMSQMLRRISSDAQPRIQLLRGNSEECEKIRRWLQKSEQGPRRRPFYASAMLVLFVVLATVSVGAIALRSSLGSQPIYVVLCFWGVYFLYMLLRRVKNR